MRSNTSRRGFRHGFTLIELLVAVTIGMALTLAITTMLIRSESNRRSLTSTNDASNSGAFLAYTLDRTLRSAGSGFAQSWRDSYGCSLQARRDGLGVFLPRAAAYPAPFGAVPLALRMAPLVVQAGTGAGGSDVLIVQAGSSGLGEAPLPVLTIPPTNARLFIPVTLGLRGGDLVTVIQEVDATGNPSPCLLQQVVTPFAGAVGQQELDLGGNFYAATLGGVDVDSIGTLRRAWVAPLGNEAGNRPSFQLLGVADTNTLVSYDLLRLDNTNDVVPISDGVVDLRARYGVDTNDDGRIDSWQSPADPAWSAATLMDGSAASGLALSRIISVRVALVMRNNTPEKQDISPASLALFDDLPVALRTTHDIAADDRKLRYRVLDFTVPLRNAMLTQRP